MLRTCAILLLAGLTTLSAQQPSAAPITIRAARLIDGRGAVQQNVAITIRGSTIEGVAPASSAATYDLGSLTLLPGFIDTHTHIGWRFDDKGKYHSGPEPADQAALYGAENAYVTLMAGFTTIQAVL